MNQFKFFKGYSSGKFDLLFGETYATASAYQPNPDSNNEMESWFAQRNLTLEPQEEIRLFNPVTITVKPNFLTRVKIFGQKVKLILKETWRIEPVGLVIATTLALFISVIGIIKLFGA
jgi:hypothetical protein